MKFKKTIFLLLPLWAMAALASFLSQAILKNQAAGAAFYGVAFFLLPPVVMVLMLEFAWRKRNRTKGYSWLYAWAAGVSVLILFFLAGAFEVVAKINLKISSALAKVYMDLVGAPGNSWVDIIIIGLSHFIQWTLFMVIPIAAGIAVISAILLIANKLGN